MEDAYFGVDARCLVELNLYLKAAAAKLVAYSHVY